MSVQSPKSDVSPQKEPLTIDLPLPDWGSYGKEYVGLSHIADRKAGHRWDCFLLCGYHRRSVIGPYGRREHPWHIWNASADTSSYRFRYQLEWKDRVYVDATYSGEGEGRILSVECVNHSDLPQNLDLHLAACLERNPMKPCEVLCPEPALWVHAQDYVRISSQVDPHREQQSLDALKPGLYEQPHCVDGVALGARNFFQHPGDRVDYRCELTESLKDCALHLRYHRWSDSSCRIRMQLDEQIWEWHLYADGSPMSELKVDCGHVSAGVHELQLELLEGEGLLVEGFALVPEELADRFQILPAFTDSRPQCREEGRRNLLSYPDLPHRYEIEIPEGLRFRRARVSGDDIPAILSRSANDSVHSHWTGLGERESQVFCCGPVALEPGEQKQFVFRIGLEGAVIRPVPEFAGHFPESAPYAFGMERLAATTCSNLVFPIRHREGYIRHNSPGRQWNSLYTWDSGMMGLGLASLDVERAKGSLNQYLLAEDDPYAAYVEHGTPLPIQAEQANQIWKQTQDREWLSEVYPKLRNFYEWLAGRSRNSTTDRFESGLLQTWDYNYNSGGWDDYPPQWEIKEDPERRRRIAPCVTTSYAIRFARHMQTWSKALGIHPGTYSEDLSRWAEALEQAWDPVAGHYSYVEHDEQGQVLGPYRHASGENYNRGFDGIIPLITGMLKKERSQQLIDFFFNPEEIWTTWGGCTVSKSAAYYDVGGYWNGAIWMPHNVMIWRAFREQGYLQEARKLAETLLGTWERESQASYHSFELFRADTGRGSGWHQFSALSSPLLMLYKEEFAL